ncbi:hypothetical protein [Desulfosarcina sp.]|uniref:hypothetical protein n=1 Tax=Desulfosarcina sp. TaxID=2027861 RepID=UPI0035635A31
MKKILSIGLALAMCVAFSGIAAAQEALLADPAVRVLDNDGPQPTVTKEITINENLYDYAGTEMYGKFDKLKIITIDTYKHINVFFNTEIEVNADGEAETWAQQMNLENRYLDVGATRDETTVTTTTTEKEYKDSYDPQTGDRFPTQVTQTDTVDEAVTVELFDYNERTAEVLDSINANSGVVGVNQSPGNMNNQANLSAMAVIAGDKQLVEANGFGVQASMFNFIVGIRSENKNTISGSISDNNGIVGVNQSSGNINNQLNSAALAAGLDPVTNGALGEATLKQVNADSFLVHFAVLRSDSITGSINGNAGIVSVNQASGDLVNQANIHAIAADLN